LVTDVCSLTLQMLDYVISQIEYYHS
jgi:hypothetical protein